MWRRDISPGFGQGSGLKLFFPWLPTEGRHISPGFGQGSGLKPDSVIFGPLFSPHLPWLRSGERIETLRNLDQHPLIWISPGFGQGSGLKRQGGPADDDQVSSPLASVRGAD